MFLNCKGHHPAKIAHVPPSVVKKEVSFQDEINRMIDPFTTPKETFQSLSSGDGFNYFILDFAPDIFWGNNLELLVVSAIFFSEMLPRCFFWAGFEMIQRRDEYDPTGQPLKRRIGNFKRQGW